VGMEFGEPVLLPKGKKLLTLRDPETLTAAG
jgi:hypothetical protein